MSGEKLTQNKMITEMYADIKVIKDWVHDHKKYHRWIWMFVIGLPVGIYYLLKLVNG
jgi:hypothetical protein